MYKWTFTFSPIPVFWIPESDCWDITLSPHRLLYTSSLIRINAFPWFMVGFQATTVNDFSLKSSFFFKTKRIQNNNFNSIVQYSIFMVHKSNFKITIDATKLQVSEVFKCSLNLHYPCAIFVKWYISRILIFTKTKS